MHGTARIKTDYVMDDEETRAWLRDYINDHCVYRVKPGERRLIDKKTGKIMNIWQVYLRRGLTNPEFMRGVARLFWRDFEPLYRERKFQLAGIETGATPLVTALAYASPPGCSSFIIRENVKKYGLLNRFEGIVDYNTPVLLVDDLCNSKNTLWHALKYCREGGLEIYDCGFVVINKNIEGAKVGFDKYIGDSFPVRSLFQIEDFDMQYHEYVNAKGRPPPLWRLDNATIEAGITGRGKPRELDYLYGYDEIVAKFVANKIPQVRERGFGGACKAIGVIDDERIIAGIVYHNYDPTAGVIQISVAAEPGSRWCTPGTLARLYQYPFHQLGCQMVIQLVAAVDERAQRQMAAMNHSLQIIPRLMGRDQDAVLGTLTYEAWTQSKVCRRYRHDVPQPPANEAA
jgi:orotate phosphoribosyltransferase